MKLKRVKIKIRSLDQALDEFVDVAQKIEKGEVVKSSSNTYIADAATARGIFTEARLAIIKALKTNKVKSIYELAKLLERDFKNVHEDVVFLAELGLIGLEESKTGRKQKRPKLLCESIIFDIAA